MDFDQRVVDTIYRVVDDVNEQLPEERHLEKSVNTRIFGESGRLDSLGLVSFVVAAEQEFETEFGKPVSLTDERAMSQKNSPFRSIGSFAEYVSVLLRETLDE